MRVSLPPLILVCSLKKDSPEGLSAGPCWQTLQRDNVMSSNVQHPLCFEFVLTQIPEGFHTHAALATMFSYSFPLSHSRGIPTVPGTVTLKKDSQNLIGISIGGGAQYCPCLYIVQVGTQGGRINHLRKTVLAWEMESVESPMLFVLFKVGDIISLP